MKKLGQVLQEFLKTSGLDQQIAASKAVLLYNQELLPSDPNLKNTHAESIMDGILKINAPNSVIAYEVIMRRHDIVQKINRILGRKVVTDIAVRNR